MSDSRLQWYASVPFPRLQELVDAGMQRAAVGLAQMTEQEITLHRTSIHRVPLHEMVNTAGDPESEMVGVYLQTEGDLCGQSLLVLSQSSARSLAGALMGLPVGAVTELGEMERSALAEVGNVMLSSFLNTLADLTDRSVRPTPPVVVVDMLGAIMNLVAALGAFSQDELLVFDAHLVNTARETWVHFLVSPDPVADAVLAAPWDL
jgi:chemotaxis protein CheC